MKQEERRKEMENMHKLHMDTRMQMQMEKPDRVPIINMDAGVDPATGILNHFNRHLTELTSLHDEMLAKLNDPDISVDEKTTITSRIETIKSQMATIQTQVDVHTKVRSYPVNLSFSHRYIR